MQLTNSREAAAFFVARAIIVAVMLFATPLVLSPLYMQLFRSGGAALMTVGTLSVGFVAWLVTLVLFLALRGGFAGVPPRVAGDGRRDRMTTSAGEIAAYLVSLVLVMLVLSFLTGFALGPIYASLRQSGGTIWIAPVSLGVSAVTAVVFFLIFIALRGAMPAAASPDAPLEAYDDGGAGMGFGRAISTCFRKYAVFSGRASRSEYWFFVLFQVLVATPLIIVDVAVLRGPVNTLTTLWLLIMLLPSLAVTVRRLHDIDMSGWFVLIQFIPFIGWIVIMIFACRRGTAGANRFGMGPATTAIPEVFA